MADKKLGVADLAKALGVQEATARIFLRNTKHKKEGRSYEFSRTEIESLKRKHAEGGHGGAKKPAAKKKATKKAAKKPAAKKKPAASTGEGASA